MLSPIVTLSITNLIQYNVLIVLFSHSFILIQSSFLPPTYFYLFIYLKS